MIHLKNAISLKILLIVKFIQKLLKENVNIEKQNKIPISCENSNFILVLWQSQINSLFLKLIENYPSIQI